MRILGARLGCLVTDAASRIVLPNSATCWLTIDFDARKDTRVNATALKKPYTL